ncbi:MAG: tryptophan synthase subunit beta [Mucinivorans sp.]
MKTPKDGFYGQFGGAFVPEALTPNIKKLQNAFDTYAKSEEFLDEFRWLLKNYVGRPSPLYFSKKLSDRYGAKIYLKREDLNHTGAHKINNTLGQILLARSMGAKRVIAETGAGSHGVAVATVCALLDLECSVYMGKVDMERQKPNVDRMEFLGAKVVPAMSGTQTLTDAVNEALADWCANPDETFYLLGSAVGPAPYPEMVAYFQSVISAEIRTQMLENEGREEPDMVIACIGGGSNAMGAFYHFIDSPKVRLVVAEAGGKGVGSGQTAATLALGKEGVLHGARSLMLQNASGEVIEPYSLSAGLDYPGIGPLAAYMYSVGRMEAVAPTDDQALQAAFYLSRHEGIIPALESAHALAALDLIDLPQGGVVVVNLSGRGDKDLETYLEHFQ